MTPNQDEDPEATGTFDVLVDYAPTERQALPMEDLLQQLTSQFRTWEGCEALTVVSVARLDPPDNAGCNWSSSIVLETKGVPPDVYSLAYAEVIASARSAWNLK